MALTKITQAKVEKSGFWIFATWRVYVSKLNYYPLKKGQFDSVSNSAMPVAIAQDRGRALWWVRGQLFWETDGLGSEEIDLLVWDRDRRQGARLDRLRKMKVHGELAKASRRELLPDDVRVFVYERDDGRCVRCGAEEDLQFDHIIPVAKGGGTAPGNIQLLCGDCNRLKSDSLI